MKNYLLISGWKEHGGRAGMNLLSYDSKTGAVSFIRDCCPGLSCNNTVWNPETGILYITNELHENPDYPKGGGGLIYAFRFDREKEDFVKLSRVEASCPCPAYLQLDSTGRYLLYACHSSFNAVTKAEKGEDGYWHTRVIYDDSIVGMYRLNPDGSIGPLVDVKKHDAYPVAGRGLHSHPHTMKRSPDGRLFACCDKGDGHIYFYKIDYEKEELVLASEPYKDDTGISPRYCVYHPERKWFFCNHERDMTVSAFNYDDDGRLSLIGTVSAVDESLCECKTSEVRKALHGVDAAPPADGLWPLEQQGFVMSEDGRYLYDMLNGADAVSVIEINQENGALTRKQVVPVDGRWIRGCALSPDGRFLAVTALQEGGVYIYPVGSDGTLGVPVSHAPVEGGSYATFI